MVQNYISVVPQIAMALKLQKMTKLQENDDVVKVLVKVGQHCIDCLCLGSGFGELSFVPKSLFCHLIIRPVGSRCRQVQVVGGPPQGPPQRLLSRLVRSDCNDPMELSGTHNS